MRRRKIILGILALVLCGILAAALWPEPSEPVYKGRKLSEWLMEPHKSIGCRGGGWPVEVKNAISAVGANGIPFYLEWVAYEPGPFVTAKIQIAKKAETGLIFIGARMIEKHCVP